MAGKLPGHSSLSAEEYKLSKNFSYGIAVALWNPEITKKLSDACLTTFHNCGVPEANLKVRQIPGSFELPLAAKYLIDRDGVDAVICLGCIIKGETEHDHYIAQAIANGMIQLQLETSKPVVFGVLTVHDKQQAMDRSGGKFGNKGEEAAITAIKMLCQKNIS